MMIDDHDVNGMAAMGDLSALRTFCERCIPFSTGGSSSRASERGQL